MTKPRVSALPKNVLLKNPAGTYSFVGTVDARLGYRRVSDDSIPDAETLRKIAQFGAGLYRPEYGVRVFKTPADAKAFADALGIQIDTTHCPTWTEIPADNRITLELDPTQDLWMARHTGPHAEQIKDLFGTVVLPTAFSNSTARSVVVAALRRLNPSVEVA